MPPAILAAASHVGVITRHGNMPTAQATVIQGGAGIKADAILNGDGVG